MPTNIPVREVPFPSSFALAEAAASKEGKQIKEPELEVDQIQGNVLAGFNKDNQTLIRLEIQEPRKLTRVSLARTVCGRANLFSDTRAKIPKTPTRKESSRPKARRGVRTDHSSCSGAFARTSGAFMNF